ncbi:hypothetical protein GCM10022215_43560 [Nocardioides fonticola]|uniref:GNAT family N-acetyltransferase n=1 Tax=Nocardioides fonticola TaxID=450363 RepID=A0ABP7Y3B4_9ACTN
MTVTLRPLTPDDAEALALLHVEVWEAAYGDLMPASIFVERRATLPERVERWRLAATTSPARTIVAIDDAGRLVGFSSDGPSRDEDLPDLHELWGL